MLIKEFNDNIDSRSKTDSARVTSDSLRVLKDAVSTFNTVYQTTEHGHNIDTESENNTVFLITLKSIFKMTNGQQNIET